MWRQQIFPAIRRVQVDFDAFRRQGCRRKHRQKDKEENSAHLNFQINRRLQPMKDTYYLPKQSLPPPKAFGLSFRDTTRPGFSSRPSLTSAISIFVQIRSPTA